MSSTLDVLRAELRRQLHEEFEDSDPRRASIGPVYSLDLVEIAEAIDALGTPGMEAAKKPG